MSRMIFVFAVCLLLTTNITLAQQSGPETPEETPSTKARLEVSEYHWDFGDVPSMVKVSHNFVLKNTGTDPLDIPKVRSGCGCTTAPLLKNRLEPGETTDLVLTFSTGNYRGKVQKTATVVSSDPNNQEVKLSFAATVNDPDAKVEWKPRKVNFVQLYEGEKRKKTVQLTNNTDSPLKLSLIEPPMADFLKLDLKNQMLPPVGSVEVEVELIKKAPLGVFEKSFTLEATGGETHRLTIPIEGEIVGPPPEG
jgi:hypothetical protein